MSPANPLLDAHSNSNQEQSDHRPQRLPQSVDQRSMEETHPSSNHLAVDNFEGSGLPSTATSLEAPNVATFNDNQDSRPYQHRTDPWDPAPNTATMFQSAHGVNISGQPHFVNIANVNQLSNLGGSQGFENFQKFVSFNALHDSSDQELDRQVHQVLRKNTLKQLQDWSDNPIVTEHIIWLHGPAGIGKTAIALEIAQTGRQKVAATFFFSRTDASRNDGKRLFPTLAWQFAVSVPDIKNHIIHSINERPDLPNKGVEAQFEFLIAQPFAAMKEATSTVGLSGLVVIIDGIDECADIRLQRRILKVIGNAIQDRRVPLRFIISSRPDAHIQEIFRQFQFPIFCIDLAKFSPAEEIRKREEEIGKREEEIGKREEEIRKREGEVGKREEEIRKREEEVGKREEEIRKREGEVGRREEEIKQSTNPSPSPCSSMSSSHELTDRSSSSFIGPITTVPEAKMENKYGEVYSRRKLYRCDAEDHPVSCHCDAPSSSLSPALASERSNIPIQMFITPERQSGLSHSAPKNQEFAQAPDHLRAWLPSDVPTIPRFPTRPPSRQQDRPDDDSQPSTGSESTSRSSSPEPGISIQPPSEPSSRSSSPEPGISIQPPSEPSSRSSSPEPGIPIRHALPPGFVLKSQIPPVIPMDLRRERSPNGDVRRLYEILQMPLSSAPPEPTAIQNSVLRPRFLDPWLPPGFISMEPLQVTPEATQPPANSYQHPPPSNVMSASDAAKAIEKSQKEKERKRKGERKARAAQVLPRRNALGLT